MKQFEFRTIDHREGNLLKRPRKAIVLAESLEQAEAQLKVDRATRRRSWKFFNEKALEQNEATVVVVFSQQGE